jgi:predicted transcriptional regulator
LAIARGDHRPGAGEPKIWFTSMRSLAEVLSDDNRALLRVIREQKPESLSRLAEITGRAPSNLSRTLKTMEHYGLVEMRRDVRTVRPIVKVSEFVIQAA